MPRSVAEGPSKRVLTGIRLPGDLIASIDAYCRSHPFRPSRTRTVERALREFLDREEAQASKSQ